MLCAQFLKRYTDIPLFKEIKPEDIENVSSHFLPLFQESRDSDTVNKIRIGNSEIYLIALIVPHLKLSCCLFPPVPLWTNLTWKLSEYILTF